MIGRTIIITIRRNLRYLPDWLIKALFRLSSYLSVIFYNIFSAFMLFQSFVFMYVILSVYLFQVLKGL